MPFVNEYSVNVRL